MSIEVAFAIEGTPDAVWEALWADLSRGGDAFEVEQAQRPRMLAVRVYLGGGVPALVTYRIDAKDRGAEVVAHLEPQSWRYNLYQWLTFGRFRLNYELVLTQGLSNLKNAVEGKPLLRPADE